MSLLYYYRAGKRGFEKAKDEKIKDIYPESEKFPWLNTLDEQKIDERVESLKIKDEHLKEDKKNKEYLALKKRREREQYIKDRNDEFRSSVNVKAENDSQKTQIDNKIKMFPIANKLRERIKDKWLDYTKYNDTEIIWIYANDKDFKRTYETYLNNEINTWQFFDIIDKKTTLRDTVEKNKKVEEKRMIREEEINLSKMRRVEQERIKESWARWEDYGVFEWPKDVFFWVKDMVTSFIGWVDELRKWSIKINEKAWLWIGNLIRPMIGKEPLTQKEFWIETTLSQDLLDIWEWWMTTAFTIVAPYFTLWINIAAQTKPWMQWLEILWEWLQMAWWFINENPWFKQFRNSLWWEWWKEWDPPTADQLRFDAFIWNLWLMWLLKSARYWKWKLIETFTKTKWKSSSEVKTITEEYAKSLEKQINIKWEGILKSRDTTLLKTQPQAVAWLSTLWEWLKWSKWFKDIQKAFEWWIKQTKETIKTELSKDTNKYKPSDTEVKIWENNVNPIKEWLTLLEKLWKWETDYDLLKIVDNLKKKFETKWLTRNEINDLAKLMSKHKETFDARWKAYKWSWVTSHENIRQLIKGYMRKWWDTSKIDSDLVTRLDKNMSNQIFWQEFTKGLVWKLKIEVDNIKKPWVKQKITNFIWQILNVGTLWFWKATLLEVWRFFNTKWANRMSMVDLEASITKSVKQYTKLVEKYNKYEQQIKKYETPKTSQEAAVKKQAERDIKTTEEELLNIFK